ncbi:MAG: RNA degradosome polyphosphate kinase [Actinobacteria bacterium]|nr:RNA degradosome polyphosphate kinase [Actinomycetota bacterium]
MDQVPHFTDRELSWLSFNQRVLELAEDESIPLLERVRFLAIFASNLDEFFMVRVATLQTKIEGGKHSPNSAGYTPQKLMSQVLAESRELMARQYEVFQNSILPALRANGIELLRWDELEDSEIKYIKELFDSRIFPVLTPLAVDPSHPFPYISGLSLNLAVIVKNVNTEEEFFARIKVPPILPRLTATSKGGSMRFIPLEAVIAEHLELLFPGMVIEDHFSFRVTRNQDFELEEEDSDDLLVSLEQELLRRRFGPPVRLEVEEGINPHLLGKLTEELGIKEESIFTCETPLDLTDLNRLADLDFPNLKYSKFRAHTAPALVGADSEKPGSYFEKIRAADILLHHPYDSFTTSFVDFLAAASQDPAVLAIKQTLYRTSGDSPIVEALIEAAEAGKQVLAVIEIRARFDEQANVKWARKLEAAGVHVVYGLMGLKTHAKLSLVVRDEEDGIRRYCHIGTGNYNPKTARLYEDIGILSCDPELTDDLTKLFNQLSGFAPQSKYSRLLVAPRTLRSGLIEKIDREIENANNGLPSGIQFKLNSLLDEEFVEALYKASRHGVKVDLLVRGICALQTGHPDSENIKVRSILGRFLEHSRILHFVNAGEDEYWIGSADLMHRNLDRRVESMVRIDRDSHQFALQEILDLGLSDGTSSWHLQGKQWVRVSTTADGEPLLDLQNNFIHEKHLIAGSK